MGSTPADLKRDPEYDQGRDELAELRALLLGQQLVELEALRKRLDDPEVRAEELSQILGKAVVLSVKRDGGLQRSFYPIVEQALKISIQRIPAFSPLRWPLLSEKRFARRLPMRSAAWPNPSTS